MGRIEIAEKGAAGSHIPRPLAWIEIGQQCSMVRGRDGKEGLG